MRGQVLLITNMFPSKRDPTYGLFVQRCASALQKNGVVTNVVALTKHRHLLSKLLGYCGFAFRANAKILLGRWECVYIHHPLHSLLACLPALALRKHKIALSFHGHDLLPVTKRGAFLQKILKRHFLSAHLVVVPSMSFKTQFDRRFGPLGASEARVFYSGGVEEIYFHGQPAASADRERSALFLSRLVREKGWPIFLEIARSLRQTYPDFTFTVAGVGPDAGDIRTFIDESGQAGYVRLVEASDATVNAKLFESHRYFIFPSLFDESLALVNIEAMARGCVVISAAFPAASEYIEHGTNGFLLEKSTFVTGCIGIICELEVNLSATDEVSRAAMHSAMRFRESDVVRQLPAILGLTQPKQ